MIPVVVMLISLVVMFLPLVALAQDAPATPSTGPAWVTVAMGLIGTLSGGGALYRQQSTGAGIEARLARLESAGEQLVRRTEFTTALQRLEDNAKNQRQETREDLKGLRAELADLCRDSLLLTRQNEQIIAALDKLGGIS